MDNVSLINRLYIYYYHNHYKTITYIERSIHDYFICNKNFYNSLGELNLHIFSLTKINSHK